MHDLCAMLKEGMVRQCYGGSGGIPLPRGALVLLWREDEVQHDSGNTARGDAGGEQVF